MFDGWSCLEIHYVALIASYSRKVPVTSFTKEFDENEQELALISLAPMAQVQAEIDTKDSSQDEATKFNTETRKQFFEESLNFYNIKLNERWKCLIADKTSVNHKIARLCGVPAIGCTNHRLNLQVERMIQEDSELGNVVESINSTTLEAKQLKNAAVFRNLTHYKPLVYNRTRWLGKCEMLSRFVHIRDEIIKASKSDCSISANSQENFNRKQISLRSSWKRLM